MKTIPFEACLSRIGDEIAASVQVHKYLKEVYPELDIDFEDPTSKDERERIRVTANGLTKKDIKDVWIESLRGIKEQHQITTQAKASLEHAESHGKPSEEVNRIKASLNYAQSLIDGFAYMMQLIELRMAG